MIILDISKKNWVIPKELRNTTVVVINWEQLDKEFLYQICNIELCLRRKCKVVWGTELMGSLS